jgi:hypothetical protein
MEAPSDSAGCGMFFSTLPSIHRSRLPRLRRASSDRRLIAHITLSAEGCSAAELPFPERHIMLDATKNTIIIGRASKTSSKGFLAEQDNGWFDSAVMSRKHAEIKADVDTMVRVCSPSFEFALLTPSRRLRSGIWARSMGRISTMARMEVSAASFGS